MATLTDRARSYVSAMPPAVSGQNGHKTTFTVAVALVHGFALAEAEAWPILAAYNAKCSPPWSEADLRHKLASAQALDRHPKPKGHLRGAERTATRSTRPVVTSIPALFTPQPIEEERPPKIYGIVPRPPAYPPTAATGPQGPQPFRRDTMTPCARQFRASPTERQGPPDAPAGYCPQCWSHRARALRVGRCICTGHVSPNSRPNFARSAKSNTFTTPALPVNKLRTSCEQAQGAAPVKNFAHPAKSEGSQRHD